MSLTRRSSTRVAVLAATVAIIAAACGSSTASTAPSQSAAASTAPSTAPSEAAYEGMVYPETGEAPCGVEPYTGNFKKITAVDRLTVEFQLCAPDVAFLSKIAFSAFGIQDSDYVTAHMADGSILDQPNGTGPYKLSAWERGSRIVMAANDAYWGDKALTPNLEFRWSAEAAQRLLELNSGNVDGIDNPGADDVDTIKNDSALKFYDREGLNVLYLGFNNTVKPWTNNKIRQAIAMGIDRQRIVDNFYPPGSEVASHFTPCSFPFACGGDDYYEFDAAAAKALLAEGMAEEGISSISTKIQFRDAVRGYLPDPPQIATEIQAQLKANLGIETTLDLQESGTFLDAAAAGTLEGIYLLGWGADYPDVSNFLDYHFGAGSGVKFGSIFPDLAAAITKGGSSAADADREAAYTDANNLIKKYVPAVVMIHGGSGTAFKADVEGAHSSPLSTEIFSVMKAADRDTLVWMQNAEPLSLFCGDESDGETLRACEQINESLYAYEVGGTKAIPSLATDCSSNTELTVWTCTLRDGVTFHDGAAFDANDVVLSFALQWDAEHPLHIGRSGAFEYFPGLFGGFLNPPPPAP
jgi:peptide/nickel transport system substrate-binding protein